MAEKLKQLRDLPFLNLLGDRIENLITHLGIQKAAQEMFNFSHSQVKVEGLTPELKKILKDESGLIISNHPYDIEPIAVVAKLPPRQNFSIIATHTICGLSKKFTEYIIPVFNVDQNLSSEKSNRLIKIPNFMKDGFCPKITDLAKTKHNLNSIKEAANRIKQNGLVFLAPEGSKGKEGKWFPGIGHLLKEIGSDTNAYFIQTFVRGTSDFDMARILPVVGRFMPKIEVFFGKPLLIKSLLTQNLSATLIAEKLESDYKNWVKSIY